MNFIKIKTSNCEIEEIEDVDEIQSNEFLFTTDKIYPVESVLYLKKDPIFIIGKILLVNSFIGNGEYLLNPINNFINITFMTNYKEEINGLKNELLDLDYYDLKFLEGELDENTFRSTILKKKVIRNKIKYLELNNDEVPYTEGGSKKLAIGEVAFESKTMAEFMNILKENNGFKDT